MDPSKLSDDLKRQLEESGPDDLLRVIVELERRDVARREPAPVRGRRDVSAAKASFEAQAEPLKVVIQGVTGTVVDAAWINRTLDVRVPAGRVAEIAEQASVRKLDVPHRLNLEGRGIKG